MMGKSDFEEKWNTAGLVVRMTKLLWGTGKVVFMNSGFYVLEGFISMVEKGVLGSTLINVRCYWPKGMPADLILRQIQNN